MKIKIFKFNIIFLVSSLLLVFGCAKEDDSKTSTDNVTSSSDTDNTSSVTSVPTGSILFSSQYSPASSGSDDTLKAVSREGGYVKAGSGGYFAYGDWGLWTEDQMKQNQAFGVQWKHETSIADNASNFVYHSFGAPDNGSVNVSNSDNIIIQMGNGAQNTNTNTHKVFTVEINGGAAITDAWPAWTNSCYYDQTLDNDSFLGQSTAHAYALRTYEIPLSSFTCYSGGGSVSALKNNVTEVVVKIVGGKDPNADNSTANNFSFPTIGFIGFND